MSVPSTSTGPRMYLAALSSDHVTSGLVGSSTTALTDSGLEQSSLVNWSRISGVIQAVSLASVGGAVGVAVPVAPSVGAGVGSAIRACGMARFADVAALVAGGSGVNAGGGVVAVELGVPVPVVSVAVAVPVAAARTARKRSCEGLRIASRVAASGVPGIDTTMLRPPWVVTSASATP